MPRTTPLIEGALHDYEHEDYVAGDVISYLNLKFGPQISPLV